MSLLWPGGFLLIALAGALGALIRYLIDVFISARQHAQPRRGAKIFPAGILVANTAAAFLVGATAAWALNHDVGLDLFSLSRLSDLVVVALILGVGGGLSTMSTFMLAVVSLWRSGARAMALSYLGATVSAGLCAGLAGILLGRLLP